MSLKDHPTNFLKPRTTSSGHSYNLRANDNSRNIVYADSCCCRTQCSGSFISFASKCVNNFYCLHSRYSVNYLLIVNLNPFNSVNSAMWQINGIYIYIYNPETPEEWSDSRNRLVGICSCVVFSSHNIYIYIYILHEKWRGFRLPIITIEG